jgi:hypothetical protein
MCKESSSREATNCPACGVTFSFLPYHSAHCTVMQSNTAKFDAVMAADKRSKEAATANKRMTGKRRGH